MKKSFKVLAVGLCLAMAVAGLAACGSSSSSSSSSKSSSKKSTKATTLKVACSAGDTSTWVRALKKYATDVEKDTDGAVKIEVYGSDQLTNGDQVAGIQAVIDGTTDMSFHSNIIWSGLSQKNEEFAVVSLPFLFNSTDDADKSLKQGSEGYKALNKALEDNGVVLLGVGENGFRDVSNSKREIKTPADMKGLKIRVAGSTVLMDAYKAWGADYTKANWSEVYTGLQTGTYDGQENPLPTMDSSSIQDVQKYCTEWTGSYDCLFLTINKAKWDSFDKDTQKILKDDANKAVTYQKKLNRKETKDDVAKFEKAGMKTELTDDEAKAFKELSDPCYDAFAKRLVSAGLSKDDVTSLLDAFGAKANF